MRPKTQCPTCKGSGEIFISDALSATLDAVKTNGDSSAPDLFRAFEWDGIKVCALNNRLEDLRKIGILDRKRTHGGKGWTYFLARRKK